MFVKYANVVEVARNSKIEIKHYGKTNCVSYSGMSGGKHQFKILSATPNVKGIEKFVGIIHELAHVLFQSPFTATRNLLQDNWGLDGERYKLFFNAFNVLEDQRIESQMGKMYLKHASRFTKTTKKLGTLMSMDDIMKTNPVNMLLAIRFHRGDDIIGLKDYDVYDKALKDVVLTDKYGALRVLVSIKPYIDAWITDKENKIKNAGNSYQTDESKAEIIELADDTVRTNTIHTQNSKESSGEDTFAEAPDDLKDTSDISDKEIDDMINQSKDKGKNIVGDIFSSLRDDGNYKKLPKNLKMINRYESNYDIDYKVSKGMSRIFKTLMMRSKEFIDYDGEEVDVESYVEGIIRGNDMGRCRVNQKTSHGVSIVISIDGSSSMQGEPIETARNLVATMFESVKNIDNVEVRANVWGGNTYGFVGMTEINTMNDVKYINLRSHQGNYMTTPTHMALDYSSSMLKQMKGSKKMMILITDGIPNHFNAGYHVAMNTYMISCKKSLVKAMSVTSNIMCIVVQSDMSFKRNPIRELFKGTKVMNVHTMKNASEKVIKQFKIMVMNSLV